MSKRIPNYIFDKSIIGAPIKYKWNNDLGLRFYADKDQNIRLYDAIDKSNFKAKMAIGILITECIIWRFEGHIDLTDALNRIEAAWAGVIDPVYVKTLHIDQTDGIDDLEPVKGPLELTLVVLGLIFFRYASGDIYLAEQVVRQATLARHLMPNKKAFSDWLSEVLRFTAQIFPCDVEYDEDTEVYDASGEKPVPMEFFDSSFQYTDETATEALRDFLHRLNHQENPYLNSPEEMKNLGFHGTPYTL